MRLMKRNRAKLVNLKQRIRSSVTLRCIVLLFAIAVGVNLSGLHLHLLEKDYFTEFSYPLETADFQSLIRKFRNNDYTTAPINTLYSEIPLKVKANQNCDESFHFLILVKSAPQNRGNREMIRKTWKDYRGDISVKTVFFLGESNEIQEETQQNEDIVVIDFVDSYYNNTIKTMVEIRWAKEHCPNFKFALLVDDDYFVSVKKLYKFTRGFTEDDKLYAGFSIFSGPLRHKIFNKWFISLAEYPYHRFPPYITAGAILLSKSALLDIHYASYYTKPFLFDDIYIAILAKKMNISPTHSEEFRFWEKNGEVPEKELIASHGFRNPERLMKFWTVQSINGYV